MILGLTFISILLQPYLEWLFVATSMFTCCRRDRKMFSLVTKNLDAHRNRNLKTAIMFAICLAFLMFAGSTFQLIGKLIKLQIETVVAADLYAMVINSRTLPVFLEENGISQFLDSQNATNGDIVSYSFCSPDLRDVQNKFAPNSGSRLKFSDASGAASTRMYLYSVPDNFMQTAMSEIYMPNEID